MKNYFAPVLNYFRSSREELSKVSWPTQQDIFRYSSLVIATSVLFAACFAFLDFGLTKLVDATIASRTAPISTEVPITPVDIQTVPVTSSTSAITVTSTN